MPDELSNNMAATGPFWKRANPRRPGEWQYRHWGHINRPEEQPLGWSYRTAKGKFIAPNYVELDHGLPPGATSDPEELHIGSYSFGGDDRFYVNHHPFHPKGPREWIRPEDGSTGSTPYKKRR